MKNIFSSRAGIIIVGAIIGIDRGLVAVFRQSAEHGYLRGLF